MTLNKNDIPDLSGKLALITGANSGIGFETTLALTKHNMKVVVACRDLSKAEEAKQKILLEVPDGDLEILKVDLSRLQSVKKAANEFREKHERLDLLINNAGIMYPPYIKTEDGFELQLGTNCFGHFLLTSLLIEMMPDSPQSRITWISSSAHKTGKIFFDDLQFSKKYSKTAAYAQSKLVCLMYALELDRKLKLAGRKIISNSAHPGGVITNLSRYMSPTVLKIMNLSIMPFITQSVADGIKPILEAALSPLAVGGQYYGPQGFLEMKGPTGLATISKQAKNIEDAKRIWDITEKYTGTHFKL